MNNVEATQCPVCNRQLKSSKSIEKGIGPVCARKQRDKEAAEQLEMELNKTD